MRRWILSLSIALAACATTGSGGRIAIDAVSGGQPLPSTVCDVSTNSDSWRVLAPATITVGRVNGDLHVVCNKTGYRTSEMIFRPGGGYGSSMGVGVGGGSGHVGLGLGLSMPLGTIGGGYPAHVTVNLRPQ